MEVYEVFRTQDMAIGFASFVIIRIYISLLFVRSFNLFVH